MLAKALIALGLFLLVGISLASLGLSIHNVKKVKKIDDIIFPSTEVGTPPTEDPETFYIPPEPFKTFHSAHVHVNGHEVYYEIPGETQNVAFQGFITARVSYKDPIFEDLNEFSQDDQNTFDDDVEEDLNNVFVLRVKTNMWVSENGKKFRVITGPTYDLALPKYPLQDGEDLDRISSMAKAEFSKPLSFDRPVQNLGVGVEIVEILDVYGNPVGFRSVDGKPIMDLIFDVQW